MKPMTWVWVILIGGFGTVVAMYYHEQVKPEPVKPDVSGVEYNTSTWDNSFYATSEVQAYGAFQPQTPAAPNTPYGWNQFQFTNNAGVVPPSAGMPTYAT
jgi:hypothetical protein